jgi:hypothetical protein
MLVVQGIAADLQGWRSGSPMVASTAHRLRISLSLEVTVWTR